MTGQDLDQIRELLAQALAPVQAVLAEHTRLLALLQQDISALRLDTVDIRRQGATNAELLEELQTAVRRIEASVNDIATQRVSSGTLAALNADMNRMQRKIADLTVQVRELRESPSA